MYAVIRAGGKQYRVEENAVIDIDKISVGAGEVFTNDEVLLISGDGGVTIGKPCIENAKVTGIVLDRVKGKKIEGLKFKPKKNYLKRYGHRQWFSRVRIDRIEV
ncbi:MAG: 50S ribosomal protein L21 [Armatimonadetes bacterium CG_4_10_14_3_um_filter_59_10]|nr:MAG: 50S ribosomal protein L21 [Armatimonadetes bacterium CG_4_10_14_3_um_filter_59_10]